MHTKLIYLQSLGLESCALKKMIPYSSGLIMQNGGNYGILKTEAVFGFAPYNSFNISYNSTDPLPWIFNPVRKETSLQESARALKRVTKKIPPKSAQKHKISKSNTHRKSKHKKCVYKFLNKSKRHKKKMQKFQKKYMMPLILGILAAKSIIIPIALKALAFISAKGLMMGFFSTVMASVLSLKGIFDNSHRYHDRKDEKTQVEIIQVPTKTDEHYYDDHYKRYDHVPIT